MVQPEEINYEIIIRHNVVTGHTDIEGGGRSMAVVIGMLEWAKRELLQAEGQRRFLEAEKNRSRLHIPGGPLG